jgi:hypothetical protein
MLYLKSFVLWLVFLAIAVAMGMARERWLLPIVGNFRAHQIGTVLVCGLIAVVVLFGTRWLQLRPGQALRIGSFWLVLTLLFEFGVFGVLLGHPWPELFADYNLLQGRLWVLVLLTEALSPYVFAKYAVWQRDVGRQPRRSAHETD